MQGVVPLGLVLGEDLALGMVADDLDVDEAAEVKLLGAEHGHDGGRGVGGMTVRGVVGLWSSSSLLSSLRVPHYFLGISAPSVRASPSIFIGQCTADFMIVALSSRIPE